MRTYLFSLLACLACFSSFLLRAEQEKEAPAGEKSRKFQFTYTATIENVPEGAKNVELWIPVPQDTAHQTITNLNFKSDPPPAIATEPELNNRIAYWKIDAAKAKGLSVSMTFDVARKEVAAKDTDKAKELTDAEKKMLEKWLKPNKLVLVGGDFEKVADAAVKGASKPNEIAKAAYDYTVSTMKYDKPADKPGWGKGSTQWACDAKFGNCTDFHAMIMSIGRTKGVPVKFEMGFPLPMPDAAKPETKAGPVGGYHCWAKLYLGSVGWVPVDASEAVRNPSLIPYYYGNLTADRVQVSTGRDVNLVPKQAEEPLLFFVYPHAEADGKKFDVKRVFAFKDL